ncbi:MULTISPECIES: signal recognition particle-docking protein FtsY [unclassified Marinobacter]|uniref:signal recognition particle-docking protein FtsY n=1 Tax=unclassified Marinobacter TaxID=83889 RepID=UPI0019074BCA|nr:MULTISPECIES: signal recognition particle-docking protein FtsY [unclassified Marinobacter]MBK1873274.1 signal recognition particle-docking protein FtsY [Marinobacter sp. 1-3A]MBK1886513.1 signal recognition particle-docking protein FtsY [Marinobacter sp. DY40_1A1]
MMAEWISVGLLALLVFVFFLDIASNRRRVPRPKPVPQRKPEAVKGPEPLAPTEKPAPTAPESLPEDAPTAVAPPAMPEPEPAKVPEPEAAPQLSVFERIKQGLGKTRASLTGGMADLFSVGKKIDEDLLEEIETTLLMADVGVTATSEIIESLTDKLQRNQLKDGEALRKALRDELHGLLKNVTKPLTIDAGTKPYVILMVGVNGVGKTTTIGKLTKKLQSEGKSVMLAAGDTFRAAAVEQLQVWGERNKVPVVAQHTGADSASVIFDAIQSGQSRGVDVVIADTAGRLQNKDNLMGELEKVVRVMKKLDATAPHEVMLVLDAGTGQNALSQAQVFQKAVGVSGITLTKLDGTAKGGIVFAIARQLQLPIRFIGVGEQVDDLRSFDAETFVDALFAD